MSGNQIGGLSMTDSELAFEYALGTLRGQARKEVERRLQEDVTFARAVAFWEEHMMAMQKPGLMPAPANTWARIAARIDEPREAPGRSWREVLLLRWALAATLVLFVGFFGYTTLTRVDSVAPNASYAAILTDARGAATLTALTSVDSTRLWLQWETVPVKAGRALQLWAISKRDGEARSLAIFSQTAVAEIALDEASARLIHDAAELVLTEEEAGGSALDQPSDQLIARGICVRLRKV